MKRSRLRTYKPLRAKNPMKRGGRLNPVSPKKRTRTGKLGIERKVGDDLTQLRRDCFERDDYRCQAEINEGTETRICRRRVTWETGEMAHLRTKRNNGDTLDNVSTRCRECHRREHTKGVEHVALTIHLAIVTEPIPEHITVTATCGAEVVDNRHAHIFDEQPDFQRLHLQIRGLCKDCRGLAQEHAEDGKYIVYGIVNGKDWRSVEEV